MTTQEKRLAAKVRRLEKELIRSRRNLDWASEIIRNRVSADNMLTAAQQARMESLKYTLGSQGWHNTPKEGEKIGWRHYLGCAKEIADFILTGEYK